MLSCLKQTSISTLGSVTLTETKSLEEVDRATEAPAAETTAVAETIAQIAQSLNVSLNRK